MLTWTIFDTKALEVSDYQYLIFFLSTMWMWEYVNTTRTIKINVCVTTTTTTNNNIVTVWHNKNLRKFPSKIN